MADEVCKSWPRLLGAPNQQSAYQKTISSYFLASCSLEMGYLQRKKFFLLHFLIFKSYFYAYFSQHITGPKFIGGGRGQTRFSRKPKFVIFFFLSLPLTTYLTNPLPAYLPSCMVLVRWVYWRVAWWVIRWVARWLEYLGI